MYMIKTNFVHVIAFIILFSALPIYSCGAQEAAVVRGIYSIRNIDSIDNYYILYARNKGDIYKIVSRKNGYKESFRKRLRLGNSYAFILFSKRYERGIMGPFSTLEVSCMLFDDSTGICVERGCVNDLFETRQLNGLFYKR